MKRPLRIAIASSGLGHVTRGIEAWAADLAAGLAVRGQDVTLYKGGGKATTDYERVLPCWQRTDRRTARVVRWLHRPAWRLGIGTAYGVEQVTFAAPLLRELRRSRVDVLHVQDPQLALIAQRASRLGYIRAAVILGHGTNESANFLRKITYLQHLSPCQLDDWRLTGVYRPTWQAIPNFIDVETFHPGSNLELRAELGIPANSLVILSVAAIKRDHKRIDHLLSEVGRLRSAAPELPVWLVVAGGREAETDGLVRLGRELLGDRVRFLVQFPRSRMPDLHRAADLFVMTSLREMMPIALIEATASGLPCLVHDHPVLNWIIGPGGRRVDMSAPGALAATLVELLPDAVGRQDLARAGRERAVCLFGREQVIEQVLEYYATCVANRRRRARAQLNTAA
jgi:glycosyltransferase involved in cell wall biosynthesis